MAHHDWLYYDRARIRYGYMGIGRESLFLQHPGYARSTLALFGIVLALGSVWTLNPATLALIIAVSRAALDDKTLQDELADYQDYARRAPCRLIPRIDCKI